MSHFPPATDAHADLERQRCEARWHAAVEQALGAVVAPDVVVGVRCRKCLLPKRDRRRPARHHRACPLHGAGTWRGILELVQEALSTRAFGSLYPVAPHVLGWTLRRVLSMAPDATKHVPDVVSHQGLVDHALDRWAGGLGFPSVVPLDLAVAAVDVGKRYPGPQTMCFRGSLFVDPVGKTLARHTHMRMPVTVTVGRPAFLTFDADQKPTKFAPPLDVFTLDAHLFRTPDGQGEVRVFAERGTPDDELAAIAEAALGLARVDAFPAHPKLRRLARWERVRARVAHRCRVELPERRKQREAWEERVRQAGSGAEEEARRMRPHLFPEAIPS